MAHPRKTLTSNGPHETDIHVGAAVRLRRKMLGMSQTVLAAKVGVTFQQMQKYEKGSNRISASKLYEIAQALNWPIQAFFDGLEQGGRPSEKGLHAIERTAEGRELAELYLQIHNTLVRKKLLELVRGMAEAT
jgi:transcriptional regulator with XRE-family HTH domain